MYQDKIYFEYGKRISIDHSLVNIAGRGSRISYLLTHYLYYIIICICARISIYGLNTSGLLIYSITL